MISASTALIKACNREEKEKSVLVSVGDRRPWLRPLPPQHSSQPATETREQSLSW